MLFNFRTFFRTFLGSWTPGKPQECDCRTWHKENTGHLFSHVRQILPVECSFSLSLSLTLSLSLSLCLQDRFHTPSGGVCVCVYTLIPKGFWSELNVNSSAAGEPTPRITSTGVPAPAEGSLSGGGGIGE